MVLFKVAKELFQFEVFETKTKAFLDSNGVCFQQLELISAVFWRAKDSPMIKLFVLPQISVIHESQVILNVAPWFESCHFPRTLWTAKTKRLNIDFELIIGVNSIQSSKGTLSI